MSQPLVLIEKEGAVSVVTLNRPEKRNALSLALMEQLCAAVEEAGRDPRQRVLILTGAGPVFCAGLDLAEGSQPDKAEVSAQGVARTLLAVSRSPLVSIAAVQGSALAGGAGLMSACDLAVIAEDAKVGYPEARRGLVAALVLTFLRRQARERDIRELLLASEPVSAARAVAMGLANRVVPAAEVMPEARRLAASVLQGAPEAVRHSRKHLDEMWFSTVAQDIERALEQHMTARHSEEAREGMAAFLEKRPPKWTRG